MDEPDLSKLLGDVAEQVASGATRFAVLGGTPSALRLLSALRSNGLLSPLPPVYGAANLSAAGIEVFPFADLADEVFEVLVVADDAEKETILTGALPFIVGTPKVLVAGYKHLDFRDPVFESELSELLVPSIANGYPNSLTHLFQCLKNAARLRLEGSICEFGTFRGGTSMFLARVAARLGMDWPVVTFDTFDGFPPRRSPLDMYDHPDTEFTDEAAVRRYFEGWPIELVVGDIVETARHLKGRPLVLSFIDTDNYSSAAAAIEVVADETVLGGAIVFDHFTGVDRFRYTLGERFAGKALLDDPRYFNLHGTGVFCRQR